MMSERVKIWGGQTARWSILGTLTIFLAFPFVWMLITAFKRTGDARNEAGPGAPAMQRAISSTIRGAHNSSSTIA